MYSVECTNIKYWTLLCSSLYNADCYYTVSLFSINRCILSSLFLFPFLSNSLPLSYTTRALREFTYTFKKNTGKRLWPTRDTENGRKQLKPIEL